MVITHHVEFPPMLCRDGVQQKQVKVRGGIRWIITTEKTREIRCSHCNRLLAKGECSILSGNAPVRDPLHTVCHSILYSKFFIPKLNGVVHKIVWRVTGTEQIRNSWQSFRKTGGTGPPGKSGAGTSAPPRRITGTACRGLRQSS